MTEIFNIAMLIFLTEIGFVIAWHPDLQEWSVI